MKHKIDNILQNIVKISMDMKAGSLVNSLTLDDAVVLGLIKQVLREVNCLDK